MTTEKTNDNDENVSNINELNKKMFLYGSLSILGIICNIIILPWTQFGTEMAFKFMSAFTLLLGLIVIFNIVMIFKIFNFIDFYIQKIKAKGNPYIIKKFINGDTDVSFLAFPYAFALFTLGSIITSIVFYTPINTAKNNGELVCQWNKHSIPCSTFKKDIKSPQNRYASLVEHFGVNQMLIGEKAVRKAVLYNSIMPNKKFLQKAWHNGFLPQKEWDQWHRKAINIAINHINDDNVSLEKKMLYKKLLAEQ